MTGDEARGDERWQEMAGDEARGGGRWQEMRQEMMRDLRERFLVLHYQRAPNRMVCCSFLAFGASNPLCPSCRMAKSRMLGNHEHLLVIRSYVKPHIHS